MKLRDFAVLDETLLREIGRLRVAAWETETSRAAEMDIWLDEFDRSARHWVVFCEGMPVAAARLSVHASLAEVPDAESYADVFTQPPPAPIASLNRLVVHPSARGAGLSNPVGCRGSHGLPLSDPFHGVGSAAHPTIARMGIRACRIRATV